MNLTQSVVSTQAAAAVATGEKRDLQPNHNVGTAVRKYFKGHGWFAGQLLPFGDVST